MAGDQGSCADHGTKNGAYREMLIQLIFYIIFGNFFMPDRNSRRTPIPEALKREVRQRCRFGCVICGMPIYHYDHVVEHAVVLEHTAENLTLLCPNHHDAKTRGRLSVEVVEEYNKSPFNSGRQETAIIDIGASRQLKVEFGTCAYETDIPLQETSKSVVEVNGRSYLSFDREEGWLTVSVIVTDMDGIELIKVVRGELVASTSLWDITYVGNRLVARGDDEKVILDITLSNSELNVSYGAFIDYRDKTGFMANSDCLQNLIAGEDFGSISHCWAANTGGAGFAITNESTPPWNVVEFRRPPIR